jgi:hypothetical protein
LSIPFSICMGTWYLRVNRFVKYLGKQVKWRV